MKKTVTINISGIVFTIDEDAYSKLQSYLNTIKGYFDDSQGRDEIMADIEVRIAEMFQEKLTDKRQVVTIEDVDHVISVMGKPEDFIDEETKAEYEERKKQEKTYHTADAGRNRRLFRDGDGSVIGGVCSGIGYYFGFDPIWLRIAFILGVFFFGTGIGLYLILWIIMPEAKTAAEKLEMKGEPVNIDNIGKTIEDEMENLKVKFEDFKQSSKKKHRRNSGKIGQLFDRFFNFLFNILMLIFKAFGKIIGFIFLCVGAFCLITLLGIFFSDGSTIISFTSEGINTFSFSDWSQLLFDSETNLTLAIVAILLLIGIPAISILYAGLKLLLGIKHEIKSISIGLILLWLVGLGLTIYSISGVVSEFRADNEIVETIELNSIPSDTLQLTISEDIFAVSRKNRYRVQKKFMMKIEDDIVYLGNPKMTIEKSPNEHFQLKIIKESKGSNNKEAKELAKSINYKFELIDNQLVLNPYFTLDSYSNWRKQKVGIILLVPEGKSVYLNDEMTRIIYDIDNVTNTWDPNMVDKTWTMLEPGLTCIGCDPDDL